MTNNKHTSVVVFGSNERIISCTPVMIEGRALAEYTRAGEKVNQVVEVVEALYEGGPVSGRAIAEFLGVKRTSSLSYIRTAVSQGRVGVCRYRGYVPITEAPEGGQMPMRSEEVLAALVALQNGKPVVVGAVAEHFGRDTGATGRAISDAKSRGWVKSAGRRKGWMVTAKGRKHAEAMVQ